MDFEKGSLRGITSFIHGLRKKSPSRKLPSLRQWFALLTVLSKKEKIVFLALLIIFISSATYLGANFYLKNTKVVPALGGEYKEGVVGQPRFINPIYSGTSDADRDLVELVFSGITKYSPQGEIIPDLLKELSIDEDEGRIYDVYLKENVFWHDGERLTAQDVIFTVKTIENPDYKSPLRANWLGVKVEEIENSNQLGIRFTLEKPYAAFLERLTLKIIPQHIWQDITPNNFPLSVYNLRPIGSGPYKVRDINQNESGAITSLELVTFSKYFENKPNITKISFKFFENEEDLITAANKGEIAGLSIASPNNLQKLKTKGFQEYSLFWPRYFAVFLNSKQNKFLSEAPVRKALNYGVNKEEILEKVFLNRGEILDSPLFSGFYNLNPLSEKYDFNQDKAMSLLKDAGFEIQAGNLVKTVLESFSEFKSDLKVGSRGGEVSNLQACLARDSEVYPGGTVSGYFGSQTKTAVILFQEKYAEDILDPWGFKQGTGIVSRTTRAKLNEVCQKLSEPESFKISLITPEDSLLKETAEILREQWQVLGIETAIESFPISVLEKDFIKPRNYEALLFGEALGTIPDLFPFWHSSQKKDPGLNLANYESSKADQLLEQARTSLDEEIRSGKYDEFQNILVSDAPAVFLYSPDYIYLTSKKIKGITTEMIVDPSKRFSGIEEWHIKTKRAWR